MSPDAKSTESGARAFWRSRRGRQLFWLAGATILVLCATFVAISRDVSSTASPFSGAPVFPDFESKATAATAVTIADKQHTTHLRLSPSGEWRVAEAHDYRANPERMRELFLGLADLKKIERKTERDDLQAALGLVGPEKGGSATLITVSGKDAKPLARLMVGNVQSSASAGQERIFIRADDAREAYLAEGRMIMDAAPTEWLDPTIVDLPRDRVRRVAVTPASGPSYAVSRATEKDVNFVLEAVPAGREMASENAANGVGAAAVNVSLDDVKPQTEISFDGASRIAFETFDGLTVTFEIITQGELHWARVGATSIPGTQAQADAEALERRTKGWAYALPEWKANLLTKSLESLLKSDASAAKSAPKKSG